MSCPEQYMSECETCPASLCPVCEEDAGGLCGPCGMADRLAFDYTERLAA